MYFPKSEAIAEAHPTICDQIRLVDQLIYEIGDFPIRIDQMSDNLGIDPPLFDRILGLYVDAGILRQGTSNYCARCEALAQPGDLECDNCEIDFKTQPPDTISVYLPTDPVIRIEPANQKPGRNALSVRIQFVGGDRGGSQRAQLQLPKEYREINDAIVSAAHRDCFAKVDAVFAATLDDMGTLYTSKPDIIHFGGHGDDRSLGLLQDQELLVQTIPVPADQLVRILREFPQRVWLCVFNTCNSAAIAQSVVQGSAVDFAIGWTGKVPDSDAIRFAARFYHHIANGLSVGQAFGIAEACNVDLPTATRVTLTHRNGLDARQYFPLKPNRGQ
jgi:hypothetical protein